MDAGDPILANDWLSARLGSDVALATSSTTLQNVTGLSVSVPANEVYIVEISLLVVASSATAEDIKVSVTYPTGASLRLSGMGGTTAGVASGATTDMNIQTMDVTSGVTTFPFGVSNVTTMILMKGILATSSTAGTFQIQAAQNTSGANTISVRLRSYILLTKIP